LDVWVYILRSKRKVEKYLHRSSGEKVKENAMEAMCPRIENAKRIPKQSPKF